MAEETFHFSDAGETSNPIYQIQAANKEAILDTSWYPSKVSIIIEYLKHCPLFKALTAKAEVPQSLVFLAFFSATKIIEENGNVKVSFLLKDKSTRVVITKTLFANLLGIPEYPMEDCVQPSSDDLMNMLKDMGHHPFPNSVSAHKKTKLPPTWSLLHNYIMRCLTSKITGMDTLSSSFLTIMYGLYTGQTVDYITPIWNDFLDHINHKYRDNQLSSHRFWSVIVASAHSSKGIDMTDPNSPMLKIFAITKIKLPSEESFPFIGEVPESMLCKIPDCPILQRFRNPDAFPDSPKPKRVKSLAPRRPRKSKSKPESTRLVDETSGESSSSTNRSNTLSTSSNHNSDRTESVHLSPPPSPPPSPTKVHNDDTDTGASSFKADFWKPTGDFDTDVDFSSFVKPKVKKSPKVTETDKSFVYDYGVGSSFSHDWTYEEEDEEEEGDEEEKGDEETKFDARANDVFDDIQFSESESESDSEAEFFMQRKHFRKLNQKMKAVIHGLTIPISQAREVENLKLKVEVLSDKVASQSNQITNLTGIIDKLVKANSTKNNEFQEEAIKSHKEFEKICVDIKESITNRFDSLKKDMTSSQTSFSEEIQKLSKKVDDLNATPSDVTKLNNEEIEKMMTSLKEILQTAKEITDKFESTTTQAPQTSLNLNDPDIKKLLGESVRMYANFVVSSLSPLQPVWRYLSEIWPHANKPKIIEYVNAHVKTKQGGVSQSSPSFGTQGGDSRTEVPLKQRETVVKNKETGETGVEGSSKEKPDQSEQAFKRFSSQLFPPQQTKSQVPPPQQSIPKQAEVLTDKDKGKNIQETEIVDAFDEDAGSCLRKRKAKGVLTQADLKRLKIDSAFFKRLTKDERNDLFVQCQDEHIEKLFKKEREDELKKMGVDLKTFFELMPQKSFDTKNTIDSQIEFPVSPNASSYTAYSPVEGETIEMESYENRLKNFYAIYRKNANPYSLLKITNVTVKFDKAFEGIAVHTFHAVRGSKRVVSIFCEADFPWMNPNDLIVLLNIWEERKEKGVYVENVRNFLANYFLELSAFDCEVASFLQIEATPPDTEVNREDFPNRMPKSFEIVYRPTWGFLVHALKDNVEISMFFKCYNKECHNTSSLKKLMLGLHSKSISKPAEVDRVSNMVEWWIAVRTIISDIIPKVFPQMIQYHV